MTDEKILCISGSLRRESLNTRLMNAARTMFPEQVDTATLHGIPLYDGDLESAEGIPDAVAALKDRIAQARGVILVTPEYNNAIPGVFKNAIDWFSRPSEDIPRVFHGRPFAVTGASPGNFGTILAQNAWLTVLRTLRTLPWMEGRLLVSGAGKVFDEAGNLADEKVRERLRDYVAGFIDFSQAQAGSGR